jgi:hypothetical protein
MGRQLKGRWAGRYGVEDRDGHVSITGAAIASALLASVTLRDLIVRKVEGP